MQATSILCQAPMCCLVFCKKQLSFVLQIFTYRRYRNFEAVVGLVWSYDPGSYAGGRGAIGRASLARQVKGDSPD